MMRKQTLHQAAAERSFSGFKFSPGSASGEFGRSPTSVGDIDRKHILPPPPILATAGQCTSGAERPQNHLCRHHTSGIPLPGSPNHSAPMTGVAYSSDSEFPSRSAQVLCAEFCKPDHFYDFVRVSP